jgi:branched-chain amino acid aminotransferase
MSIPRNVMRNGKLMAYDAARIGVLTHGLNYGTACFGGIRGYWNSEAGELFLFRPMDHFARFLDSMKLLQMQVEFKADALVEQTVELLRAESLREDCYVRPLAYYGDEMIGCRLNDLTPTLSIVAVPFGRYLEKEEGAHATISSWRRVDDNIIPARGKISGAYVNSALAKTDALHAGFDEAILLGENGHVSEGSAENIFIVRRGIVSTPPITDNILEGIVRRTVMELLQKELNLSVIERPIDRSELYLADEIFFCGTGVQVASVCRIDHRPIGIGRMGPVTCKLREVFFQVVRGNDASYSSWCVPVHRRQ